MLKHRFLFSRVLKSGCKRFIINKNINEKEHKTEEDSNTLVIHESKTGFTEKYAKWIAQALCCDIFGNKILGIKDIAKYDTIILRRRAICSRH